MANVEKNNNGMRLFVVIPHFIITEETAQLARNAIKSFKETCDCTIINCDDASPYDTEFLKEISDVYIRNEENKGFAENCNVGFNWILENVKEDCWVVCANNDIEVYEGWFEEFVKTADMFGADALGGYGYMDKIVEGRHISEYKTNVGSLYNSSYVSEGGSSGDRLFPGGFYMIRKSLLEECGLYDEVFQNGYEDIDLFLRWKQMKKRLIMTPKVPYWHKEGATRFSDMERGRQSEDEIKNRAYFKQKHGFDAHEKMNTFLIDNRINQ